MSSSRHIAQRRRRAIERLLEDDGLTASLTDDQARALLQWATRHAERLAKDETVSDSGVEQGLLSIRRVILQAAADSTSKNAEQRVALAEGLLGQQHTVPLPKITLE